jgi:hypothetical protein
MVTHNMWITVNQRLRFQRKKKRLFSAQIANKVKAAVTKHNFKVCTFWAQKKFAQPRKFSRGYFDLLGKLNTQVFEDT